MHITFDVIQCKAWELATSQNLMLITMAALNNTEKNVYGGSAESKAASYFLDMWTK
jgi:hypothetical protein